FSKTLIAGDTLNHETICSLANNLYSEAFNLGLQFRNIFAAAETEAGEAVPSVARVNINKLIKNTLDMFTDKAGAKGINIVSSMQSLTEEDPLFVTDPEKLQLIVINLLNNAIEFSNEYGQVEVSVWKHENSLRIAVKDMGPGIDKAYHEIVFDRFRQLDSGSAKSHLGHGLGLSVTKALVEMLNGTISLNSENGQGATFTISVTEADTGDQVDVFSENGNEFIFGTVAEEEF
ncbi:MAG: ATP-binding protein, partial [Nitrospirota bacterium]